LNEFLEESLQTYDKYAGTKTVGKLVKTGHMTTRFDNRGLPSCPMNCT